MAKYKISGVPITCDGKLVGILTNRDLRFETNFAQPIANVMTKDNLVTAPEGTSLSEAQKILGKHRIEKLPIVDKHGYLKGLITIKDIEKSIQYPNSARDKKGRLLAGAAIGASADVLERVAELVNSKVDIVVLDSAHGHSLGIIKAVEKVKKGLSRPSRGCRKRCYGGGYARPFKRRRGRSKSGYRPRFNLHDAYCRRHRYASAYGGYGLRGRG